MGTGLSSCLCSEAMLLSEDFQQWADRLRERKGHVHRKVWERCFICQALMEHGQLTPGKRGLGFAVGEESLASLFATYGVNIVATDIHTEVATSQGWVSSEQHAGGLEALNKRGICDEAQLRRLVQFKFADMNHIGAEFDRGFDFVWSSCAFEHLGTLEHGKQFVLNAMRCLKPGGVAVHTTEFNLSSNDATIDSGNTVLYRRQDIEALIYELLGLGHRITMDWQLGAGIADSFVDLPPYQNDMQLRLRFGDYNVTSLGIIVEKGRE